jgi:hypothetical protein
MEFEDWFYSTRNLTIWHYSKQIRSILYVRSPFVHFNIVPAHQRGSVVFVSNFPAS